METRTGKVLSEPVPPPIKKARPSKTKTVRKDYFLVWSSQTRKPFLLLCRKASFHSWLFRKKLYSWPSFLGAALRNKYFFITSFLSGNWDVGIFSRLLQTRK